MNRNKYIQPKIVVITLDTEELLDGLLSTSMTTTKIYIGNRHEASQQGIDYGDQQLSKGSDSFDTESDW